MIKAMALLSWTCFISLAPDAKATEPPEAPEIQAPAEPPEEKAPTETQTEPQVKNAPTETSSLQLDVVYVADTLGRFFTPDCIGKKPRSYLVPLARTVQTLVQESTQNGRHALVLGGGNLFSPDTVGHYLLSTLSGAIFVAGEFRSMGMAASAWGPMDLLAPDAVVSMAARIFFRQEMPLVATNAHCAKGQEEKCRELMVPSLLLEANGVKIGLLALFPEKFTSSLPPSARKRLSFSDPAAAYREHRTQLLKQGAQVIFVISHLDTETTFPTGTLAFLRGLDVPEPAVVFSTGAQHPSPGKTGYIPLIQRTEGALIVGASRFGRSALRLHLSLRKKNTGWSVDANASRAEDAPVEIVPMTPADPGSLQLEQFCSEFNQPLGRNVIEPAMDADAFLQYVLGILRSVMRTELAVINRDALNPYDFPVSGPVTRELIMRLLRADSNIVVMKIKGKALKELLGPYAEGKSRALAVLGLEKTKNGFTVNRRDIDDEMHYAIATTQYVASGGGGILPEQKDVSLRELRLQEAIADFFIKRSSRTPLRLRPKNDFPDLWKNYVWNGGGNVGLSLGHSNVARTGVYADKPKLAGQDLTSTNIDVTLFTGISNMHQAFSARSRLLYGKTWTSVVDGATGTRTDVSQEVADEIRLNLLYQLKTPKNHWWQGSWWAPVPFVDAGLTSEFTPSLRDESLRSKIFAGLAGLGMEVWENRLFFKAGGGIRRDVGEDDTRTQRTLYAGWQLNNGDLFPLLGGTIKGESRLDFYVLQSDDNPRAYEIQASTKLYFALNSRIFFNFTHEVYALKREGGRWSWAMDFLFGVNVLFDARIPFIVN